MATPENLADFSRFTTGDITVFIERRLLDRPHEGDKPLEIEFLLPDVGEFTISVSLAL